MNPEPMMSEGPDVPPVRNWSPIIRRLILGLLVGAAVTSLPWLASRLGIESLWPINILQMPGTIVALIFSGWNVHTYDFSLLLAANVVFYTGLTYALLSIREKRKQSNRNHPSSTV